MLDASHRRRRPRSLVAGLLCALVVLASAGAMVPRAAVAALSYKVGLHELDDDRRAPLEKMVRAAEADVAAALRTRLDGELRVDFAGSDAAFRQLVEQAGAGSRWSEPWIAGLALLDQQRVLIRLDGPGLLHTSETVRHELAHVAVHALGHGRWLPRWYHESVAMLVAGEATADRLRDVMGAGASGQLATLDDLEAAFSGHRLDASRAYATAAGFLRFALRRSGDAGALGDLHERLHHGLDFSAAWVATFGVPPDQLFALYARFLDSSGSQWALFLGDGVVWSVVSLLFILSLMMGWWRRPALGDGQPMDLEAIARAGEYAIRTGRFVPPLDDAAGRRGGEARPADDGGGAGRRLGGDDDDANDDDANDGIDGDAPDDDKDSGWAADDDADRPARFGPDGATVGHRVADAWDDDDALDDDIGATPAGPPPTTALARGPRPGRLRKRYEAR